MALTDDYKEYDDMALAIVDDLGPPTYHYHALDFGTWQGVIIHWGEWTHATRYPGRERVNILDILARERLVNWVMNKHAQGFTPKSWGIEYERKFGKGTYKV